MLKCSQSHLVGGLSRSWMLLSSWIRACRPTHMLEFGTAKLFLFIQGQQEKPRGDEDEEMEEERDRCFSRVLSLQLTSCTLSLVKLCL